MVFIQLVPNLRTFKCELSQVNCRRFTLLDEKESDLHIVLEWNLFLSWGLTVYDSARS